MFIRSSPNIACSGKTPACTKTVDPTCSIEWMWHLPTKVTWMNKSRPECDIKSRYPTCRTTWWSARNCCVTGPPGLSAAHLAAMPLFLSAGMLLRLHDMCENHMPKKLHSAACHLSCEDHEVQHKG